MVSSLCRQRKECIEWRNIIRCSVPATAALALEPVAEIIDTALLAQIHPPWVAAVAATNAFLGASVWAFNFLSYSVTAQLGHAIGANQDKKVTILCRSSVSLALTIRILIGAVLIAFRSFLLKDVLGISETLYAETESYWLIRLTAFPFSLTSMAGIGILRGLGAIRPTLSVVAISTASNAIGTFVSLNYFSAGVLGAGARYR